MPKILPIKIYPDKILRQKAKKVRLLIDKRIQQLILDMVKTLKEKGGVGLAANQVGELLRIIVIATKDGVLALVNPRILKKSLKKELEEEGCLSFPGVFCLVKRPKKIKVLALNKEGKKLKFTAEGLFARVVCHEIDHLDGILFIDKMEKITQGKEILEKMKKGKY